MQKKEDYVLTFHSLYLTIGTHFTIQWNTNGSVVRNMHMEDENTTLAFDVSGFYCVYSRIYVGFGERLLLSGLNVINSKGEVSFEGRYTVLAKKMLIRNPHVYVSAHNLFYFGKFQAGQKIFLTLKGSIRLYKGQFHVYCLNALNGM